MAKRTKDTLLIGHKYSPLLCYSYSELKNGTINFSVDNGGWRGTLKDGSIKVHDTGKVYQGELLWRGHVPAGLGDYNGVIEWILRQIE